MRSTSGYVDLKTLPHDHPLRNAPLVTIAARRRFLPGGCSTTNWRGEPHCEAMQEPAKYPWKYVLPSWRIALLSYNDLGAAWESDFVQWQGREPQALVEKSDAEYPSPP